MDGEMMVTVGVDTHTDVHVAAVLDPAGRLLETRAIAASAPRPRLTQQRPDWQIGALWLVGDKACTSRYG